MALADTAELVIALTLRDRASGGLRNFNAQLKGMQGGFSDIGRGIGQVGRGLDRIATRGAIAAATGLGAVITAAVSFEDAFVGVRKTVDASESQFGDLEDRLREMARTMPVAFEELAGIAEAGGALGIAFEGLDEFTDVVAKLAATTDLSSEQAATSLGVLGNVLQLRTEDFDNFGSALVDLGNKGASTESQILGIAERAGAAGQLIGLSSDQVLAFGAAAANMGIEVEAGGSALQRFFIDALTAVEGGGKDLQTFADVAGQSADDFQRAFRQDAGAALADFIEGLGELPQAVQIQTLQDLGFNDVRISRLLLGLAGDFDNLEDSMQISATAFAENSALGVEAEKRFKTVASQLQILKQNVTDAAVTIGSELLPVVADLTSDLVEFINQPDTQRNIREFGQNLASGIRDFITEVKSADFGPLLDTLKGAAAIAKGAFDAFRALPQPIQQLALAALVANKVTGGAVGSIASGLGNILKGVIKLGFERGSTPANPLFVSAVGGLGGGLGGGGGVPGGRRGGALNTLFKGAGLLMAAEFASEFGDDINRFGTELHDALDFPDAPDWLKDFLDTPIHMPDWARDLLAGPGRVMRPGGPKTPATSDDGSFDRFGAKLDKLATNEVIQHLSRTTEIGLKGVGTSFQDGLATGLDPIGDIATGILARAENPKDPPVMTEIRGHIAGLEEIQKTYLEQGDQTLAAKVQDNIDTLHALIGTVDENNAISERSATAAALSDEKLARIATDMSPTRIAAEEQARRQFEALAAVRDTSAAVRTGNSILAGKRFDPKITVQNFVSISATVLQQQLVSLRTTVGGGGFI